MEFTINFVIDLLKTSLRFLLQLPMAYLLVTGVERILEPILIPHFRLIITFIIQIPVFLLINYLYVNSNEIVK